MADEEKKEGKEYDVKGGADVTGPEGEAHKVEVEGKATVTNLTPATKEIVSKKEVTVYADGSELHTPINLEDAGIQGAATHDAARDTAKAAAGVGGAATPSAFTRRGGVD